MSFFFFLRYYSGVFKFLALEGLFTSEELRAKYIRHLSSRHTLEVCLVGLFNKTLEYNTGW